MSEIIDVNEIFKLLPHRYPFLLIDKVTDYKPFDYVHAVKNVTINEPFFEGHFTNRPIMPGVLILEALAQTCGVLCSKSLVAGEGMEFLYYFAGIDNARFKYVVTPGDRLDLKVKLIKHKRDIWKLHGEAFVDGELACSADLMSAVKEVKKSDR